MGHEYVGVVQAVGSQVATIAPGEFVVGSFFASDNTCELCQAGYHSACLHREPIGALGAQAELLRVPLADGTLVATPDIPSDDLVPSLLAASDVLGTGWFGAVAAEAGPHKTVAVVGDGAVGLLAVLAASQLGAERIIAMSRHEPRQQLAREFGATDIVTERGDDGVARIKELTGGLGAHSVVEAVGTQESMLQAIGATRPGGHVGYVGVAHGVELPVEGLFWSLVHLHGGPGPGAPLPARADRPDLDPADRPRQGLRPDPATGGGRRGLQSHGRTPIHQGTATPVDHRQGAAPRLGALALRERQPLSAYRGSRSDAGAKPHPGPVGQPGHPLRPEDRRQRL
jgi:threonine dehydrogenase-like Zn-dependent dehydrogenase